MSKNENFKTLSEISKKFEYILIYGKDEFLEALENNMPVIVLNKKKPRPNYSGGTKHTTKTDLILKTLNDFIAKQEKFNAKQEKNWAEQRKFNASIMSRLDNIDSRLDNIVKLNNLKE